MGYDAWLEAPYQRMAEEAERRRCPECDEIALEEDDYGVTCSECSYSYWIDVDSLPGGADDDRFDREEW